MPERRLYLFGPPRLICDGVGRSFSTRKAWALLAYLAISGQSHRRDTLALLLWPDAIHSQARANLRNLLWLLNRALGDSCLLIEREAIALPSAAGLWVDVTRFSELLEDGPNVGSDPDAAVARRLIALSEAAALYTDDFLAGFTLTDSESWDGWQLFQSEGLRQQLSGALQELVRLHSARENWESAIPAARRWLAIDPLNESAHQLLMQLYAWSGERAAAARQYQSCALVLHKELGVAPLPETTELYQTILAGERSERRNPLPLHEGVILPPLDANTLPLVGRTREWNLLKERYSALGADGYLITLEGEAGIGKSRLAEELLAFARARGARVLTGRSYEGESTLAYNLLATALRSTLAERDAVLSAMQPYTLSELARLLPEVTTQFPDLPAAPALDSPGAQGRFFQSILEVVTALGRGPVPGVLFLDDLHWADGASLEFLAYLARRLSGRPVLLLVTWRAEQVAERHRLRLLLAEAQRAGTATSVRLSRLDVAAVRELLQAAPGVYEEPETLANRLFQESDGLPFFLTEYLTALSNRAIEPEMDSWRLPRGVRDLLQARLSIVAEQARQLLSTAAVVGRPAPFDVLQVASGRSEAEAVTALEELTRTALLIESSDPRGTDFEFSHEKLRALVYEQISAPRRRLLHRRVAETLAHRARGRADAEASASQIAYHFRISGQDTQAADYYRRAGLYARSLYANREALSHFEAALALGDEDRGWLREAIGDAQTLLGRYRDALASYHAAASSGEPRRQASATHKVGQLHARRGEWAQAAQAFAGALDFLDDDTLRAPLLADWSLAVTRLGEMEQARILAALALENSAAAEDRKGQARAHNILGILARMAGDLEGARNHLQQSLKLLEGSADPTHRVAALNNLSLVCSDSGDRAQALDLTRAALELCAAQGDRHREAALHSNLADLLHAIGERAAALEHLKQSAQIYAAIDRDSDTWQPEIWKLVEW